MDNLTNNTFDYPVELKTYLTKQISSSLHVLSDELENLYEVLKDNSSQKLKKLALYFLFNCFISAITFSAERCL